jgi:hypothetical protein
VPLPSSSDSSQAGNRAASFIKLEEDEEEDLAKRDMHSQDRNRDEDESFTDVELAFQSVFQSMPYMSETLKRIFMKFAESMVIRTEEYQEEAKRAAIDAFRLIMNDMPSEYANLVAGDICGFTGTEFERLPKLALPEIRDALTEEITSLIVAETRET